ncbi:MAG TPA: hypothetical protein ENI85_02025 [Deltaproteobacteria bacterium]|nr:hypothetical protein [Deltaproteobacteria bacterium]
MRFPTTWLIALAIGFAASTSEALPILALDLDPMTAGVQSSVEVDLGAVIDVDIVVSNVEPSAPLNAFEMDVAFDGGVVAARSVSAGDFLLPPVFEVQLAAGASQVDVALASLVFAGATGEGILARFQLEAVGVGVSVLAFQNVILSEPLGIAIRPESLLSAGIRVRQASAPIPEPTSALLFGAGCLVAFSSFGVRKTHA